jgi:E3 ubiquitin-protein ligase SHPRH
VQLEAVVRRLRHLLQCDPGNRVLVFSAWKDALDLLDHALRLNGVAHAYPQGTGAAFEVAVAPFRCSATAPDEQDAEAPSMAAPRVLLLPLKQGQAGLTLVGAQHVVLLEPQLDPAAEAQAMGRIDRIGQQKETTVHRFLVHETVEDNVYKIGQQRAAAMDLSSAAVKRGKSAKEAGALSVGDVAALLAGGSVVGMAADGGADRC